MTLFYGIGHYSRVGKDTFANALIAAITQHDTNLRVVKRSFAGKLKEITHELYAWAGVQPPEHYETVEGAKDRDLVLPALGMTPVDLWVRFGTDAVRKQVYDRTWLDYLLKTDHAADIVVIPDVRFPNEADAVKQNGMLIKIVRPGFGPRNTVADRALLDYGGWDYVLGAGGTVASLEEEAQMFADWIAGERPRPEQTAAERAAALSVERIEFRR